ncbi:DUF6074 family protein [Cucumibacter marinus]|uniref:DUF6074 family protein n=1 Tax=Cucumibacter marinus TaxID=1121252 RepID=UPI00048FE0A7|nr:DUF6074 family protein [Cucumibacter marinus]
MEKDDHPNLFSWAGTRAPSGARVIPFPQDRNVGKARHVASLIRRKSSDKERESYWRQVVQRMAKSMTKAGLNDEQVQTQLVAFRNAVEQQLNNVGTRTQG